VSHERDREHRTEAPPKEPVPHASEPCPDRKRHEHPTTVPREPVDPRTHPSRRPLALRARPA
jgi:hypothetical protein